MLFCGFRILHSAYFLLIQIGKNLARLLELSPGSENIDFKADLTRFHAQSKNLSWYTASCFLRL